MACVVVASYSLQNLILHNLGLACSINLDDLMLAWLAALGLEEAANGGDDGLGHLRRRRGFGGRVLPRPG